MKIITLKQLKWSSTVLILFGILLTNLNLYPLNIFSHGLLHFEEFNKYHVICHYINAPRPTRPVSPVAGVGGGGGNPHISIPGHARYNDDS